MWEFFSLFKKSLQPNYYSSIISFRNLLSMFQARHSRLRGNPCKDFKTVRERCPGKRGRTPGWWRERSGWNPRSRREPSDAEICRSWRALWKAPKGLGCRERVPCKFLQDRLEEDRRGQEREQWLLWDACLVSLGSRLWRPMCHAPRIIYGKGSRFFIPNLLMHVFINHEKHELPEDYDSNAKLFHKYLCPTPLCVLTFS